MSDRPAQPGETVESPGWTPQLRAAIDVQFARVRELWRRLDDALLAAPTPGSVSDQDHSSGDRLAACSHDLAATFLRATIDHLVTWDKLLGGPGNGRPGFQPTFAHLSLLRTAHESAWLAYWLTEPGITPDRRLARGLAAQHDDLDERRKIELALGCPMYTPPAKSAADRLGDLLDQAETRGLTKLDRKGKRSLATPLLSAVGLFDMYEPARNGRGSYIYRLYSGYAHGKQWALAQGAQAAGPADASGTTLASIRADVPRAVLTTQLAVNAMEKAVNAFIALRSRADTS